MRCSLLRVLFPVLVAAVALNGLFSTQSTAASLAGGPLVTYWNAGSTDTLTNDIADQAVAGGYNLVWVADGSTLSAQLSLAQAHGLQTQLCSDLLAPSTLDNATARAKLDALIDTFKASPAAYSYFIGDEPNASQFADLSRLVNYLRQRDPDHLAYINLYPTYATTTQLGASTYAQYLNQYVSTVQPALLSYDHYQLMRNSDTSGYLQNLGLISQKATQAGIPFMNIVQACNWDSTTWRVPNAEQLRYLVYSTLAYGAQGISYFNYWTPNPNSGGLQPNADGTPTSVYTALTPLNNEFKNIAAQYASLKLLGDYLKGYRSTSMPPGTAQLPTNSPFDIAAVSNNMFYYSGYPLKGVLFGLFDKDGSTPADATVALVENLDYSASYTYTLTGPGKLSIFNATTGVWTAMGSSSVKITLPPGGGLLVGLTSEVPEPSTLILIGIGAVCCAVYACPKKRISVPARSSGRKAGSIVRPG
jgi:hypothetical protein